jgi:hypothetical protein
LSVQQQFLDAEGRVLLPPPPDFRGLVPTPRNEIETVVLASMMLDELGFAVRRAGDLFPDWTILVPSKKGMREVNVEVEWKSRNFAGRDLAAWRRFPGSCQLILCWENDGDLTDGALPILDLKSAFYRLPPARRRHLCWEASLVDPPDALEPAIDWSGVASTACPLGALGVLPTFRGLTYTPTNELETIVLASRLLARGDFCIARAGTRYPDWTAAVYRKDGWDFEGVEVEYLAAEFETHRKAYAGDPSSCSRILAWDSEAPRGLPPVQSVRAWLREAGHAAHLCLGLEHPDPQTVEEVRDHFGRDLREPVRKAFLTIFDGLCEFGFRHRVHAGRGGSKSVAFQLVPKALRGAARTETLNLFSTGRGRYTRPTMWWSVSTLEATDFPKEHVVAFRKAMSRSGPGHEIGYGVHGDGRVFADAAIAVVRLGREVATWASRRGQSAPFR